MNSLLAAPMVAMFLSSTAATEAPRGVQVDDAATRFSSSTASLGSAHDSLPLSILNTLGDASATEARDEVGSFEASSPAPRASDSWTHDTSSQGSTSWTQEASPRASLPSMHEATAMAQLSDSWTQGASTMQGSTDLGGAGAMPMLGGSDAASPMMVMPDLNSSGLSAGFMMVGPTFR